MIEARNLTKMFGSTVALDGLTMNIAPGTVYGLVGSNGSGKSTFLRLISGVYCPDGGELLVDGEAPFDNINVKSGVFFLPDTPCFIHQSNLYEMARFYRIFYPGFSGERFKYLLSVFPLKPEMRISRMSKGMQRQAALILALSTMPRVLLLDEAFDGLDPVIRQVLRRLISTAISEQNLTVIIASHNLRELEDLCDHVGLLHFGKILWNSELDELKSQLHKVQAAFPASAGREQLEGLDILRFETQGQLSTMVIRGDFDEIDGRLRALDPLFLDILPPTLEELFIFELEVTGYDVRNILS